MALNDTFANTTKTGFPLKLTRKLRLDRIGSVTSPASIGQIVEVSPEIPAEEGIIIAGRALGENKRYGTIELPNGRQAKVIAGNLVAGALGARQALHGYMGRVPDQVQAGDRLALLNIGGVIGVCTSPNLTLGPPIEIEVLGCVLAKGKPVNIKDFSLPPCGELRREGPPLLLVLGTCMNSGKTFAATETIRILSGRGVRIAAGKLAGVAALRDTLAMMDNGAEKTASFLDCGLPSTVNAKDLAAVARSVIAHLEKADPELIVLELGDGVMGGYNGGSVLEDRSIHARTRARILCANDIVGAWGGVKFLEPMGHCPDILSGPVTDNGVGTSYIERELGIPCANAMNDPHLLADLVAGKINVVARGE